MTEDANQDPGPGLSADVVDLTERRRLQMVREHREVWFQMCAGLTERLAPHPTKLGDVRGVSPTGWSRAKTDPRYNALYKLLLLLAERWTEGADRQDLLEAAILPLSFLQTLFSLDGEQVDVPEAIQRSVERIAEASTVTVESIMDGELTPEEKDQMREVLRSLEMAARVARTAVSQTPEQTSLWPARVHGPRT